MILITYTTLYRKGGDKFARAAQTMAAEKATSGHDVRCIKVESKADFVAALGQAKTEGCAIEELHFIGHSGMYGPMFRTTAMPEQFSPHEWRGLEVPFATNGQAYFHACRTARWFAPFFARTFGVPTHGYHWYTTVSGAKERFRWRSEGPVYVVGCPGRKSHGILGTLGKYTGLRPIEALQRFEPRAVEGDASYDSVASLYDEVFADITVRRDEVAWIERHLPAVAPRVLDIGCGNGALLKHLAPRLAHGAGVDVSEGMIARAQLRHADEPSLSFTKIDGPKLPFPDHSFDVVLSMLSFRYLDWDPIMNEIRRVLKPGGRILIVDMVTAPVRLAETPQLVKSTLKVRAGQIGQRSFTESLKRMVKDERWQTMLKHNPIRAEHEMKWYLESRFPGRAVEKLNVGWNARVLAFDSGPLQPGIVAPQSYP